jgi:hypothetical protein
MVGRAELFHNVVDQQVEAGRRISCGKVQVLLLRRDLAHTHKISTMSGAQGLGTHVLHMNDEQALLVHLVKGFPHREVCNGDGRDCSHRDNASEQRTFAEPMCQWYSKRQRRCTKHCNDCCNQVIGRCVTTNSPCLLGVSDELVRERRGMLTKGTNTSRVGIVRSELVSNGKIWPKKYVAIEISFGFEDSKGFSNSAARTGTALRKKRAAEPMLISWIPSAANDCIRSMLVHTVRSWTVSTVRYCEAIAPMFRIS